MTGEDFYDQVDKGSINGYDGIIGYVCIDGYISNLGLNHTDLAYGDFRVDGKTWLKLCQEHEIIVEWCGKQIPPPEQISTLFSIDLNADKSYPLYGNITGLSYDYWRI